MAEHDSEREPEEKGAPLGASPGDTPGGSSGGSSGASSGEPPGGSAGEEQHVPFDEDAAWRAIVAGFGTEPPDPPGTKPFRSVEDLALLEAEPEDAEDKSPDAADAAGPAAPRPLGSSVAFAPGVGAGPRDYSVPDPVGEDPGDPDSDDEDEDGEGHFVPPEPPPLPEADATAKFAWLGVIGGPVLLLLAVLLGWEMTWWLTTLGIGGFLGGFATLVMRMNGDDEGDDDPGRGAVV
ncbi:MULTISPECIES: hypothetical protein [Streptomyces]|uniref:Transmembrane protein n=1 Tax=Streptomyces stelliscabiei TaxID=146820 RepID=A0A8I0TP52_9ACTN|nr:MULTISPECIES: hypothetical protein [Streptomyces]KND41277.1 membrane protein [Streptomyces stelliscabiei]MBE1596450.1 hypothetical protein [Streptomyces stelliscabiei]MDX2557504.1 hypothetical protein [Streptomyces stelliscabiei]MDX2617055.1 hypothetical protein [Streptomyces stelliscabiei]MDX2633731.1 hypothetical protein [Streptomyces stelliscabiei]